MFWMQAMQHMQPEDLFRCSWTSSAWRTHGLSQRPLMSDLASPRSMKIGSPRRRSQKYQISFPSFGFAARWAENLRCSAQTPAFWGLESFVKRNQSPHRGVPCMGVPKNGWFIMENPWKSLKMNDNWGYRHESGNLQIQPLKKRQVLFAECGFTRRLHCLREHLFACCFLRIWVDGLVQP